MVYHAARFKMGVIIIIVSSRMQSHSHYLFRDELKY